MNKKLKSILEKIQGIVGVILLVAFVLGIIMTIYRKFTEVPEIEILKSTTVATPAKNVLFWYEEGIEKTDPLVGRHLSFDGSSFSKSLYTSLKEKGMATEEITTMSEEATKKMIELDAYRGQEPDVLAIAEEKGFPYIFKIIILSGSTRSMSLRSATYQFSLYDVSAKTLIWEAQTTRSAGFFGGVPDNEETVSHVENHLKEAKILK